MADIEKANEMDSTYDELTLSLLEKRNSKIKKDLSEKKEKWLKERDVFELQLTQLQEQLVASMVQNEQMESEIKKLKKSKDVDTMKQLEEEREERKSLEERLQRLLAQRQRSVNAGEHNNDDNTEHGELAEAEKEENAGSSISKRKRVKGKFLEYKILVWNFFHERFSDFINEEDIVHEEDEEEQLSVRRLKENIARFSDAIEPVKKCYNVLNDLFSWKNPWVTLTIFLVYIYSIWLEMFIPLCFMLMILQLTINYLHARGIAQKFTQTKKSTEKEELKDEGQTSLSERYHLVLQIARKVQNTLGNLANSVEKCQNLLLCQHKEAARKMLQITTISFVFALLLPTNIFLMFVGLLIGLKLFLITPIYVKFPKVQHRYDDLQRIWEDLPNHAENQQRKLEEYEQQNSPKQSPTSSSTSGEADRKTDETDAESKTDTTSWETIIFCDRFHLPKNELPLHDWLEGRRCTLMDKESPLSSMKHGRLYLTSNYLCFERNQFHTKKNIAIKLADITNLKKAKPISFMPGSGMAIEVKVKEHVKPYIFAAMMGRDDAHESIVRAGKLLNLPWSKM